jgi:hypothetical protein
LQHKHGRKNVEIDLAESAVHYKVAQHSNDDQHVERWLEQIVVTDIVKSDEGGLHELTTGHENQATMVFRTFSEIDRQRHAR